MSVVPGAIGAWRVSAVREAGGYHTDTVAEDADLTMALLRRGYRVEYEDMALALHRGADQCQWPDAPAFPLVVWYSAGGVVSIAECSRAKGVLGWVALPNIVIFQILLPLVSPLIDIMFAVGTIWYFIQKHFHPDSTDPASFHKLVAFFFAFLVIDFLASAIAFALERRRPDDTRRYLAAQPSLVAAVCLPAVVLDCSVQDAEARARRPQVCLGQTGTHRGGELRSGGNSGFCQRALTGFEIGGNASTVVFTE